MGTEYKHTSLPELPRFDGSDAHVAIVNAQLGQYDAMIAPDFTFGFDTVGGSLPFVVADVPEEERAVFQSFPAEAGDQPVGTFAELMPQTHKLILDRTASLGVDFINVSHERRTLENGKPAVLGGNFWHVDALALMASDTHPTEFLADRFQVRSTNGFLFLKDEVMPHATVVPAKPFEIVLMTPLTVHRSPISVRNETRNRMEIGLRKR